MTCWGEFCLHSVALWCRVGAQSGIAERKARNGETRFPLSRSLKELGSSSMIWKHAVAEVARPSHGRASPAVFRSGDFGRDFLFWYKMVVKMKNSFLKVSLSRVLNWHFCLSEVPPSCCFVMCDGESLFRWHKVILFALFCVLVSFFPGYSTSMLDTSLGSTVAASCSADQTQIWHFLAEFSFCLTLRTLFPSQTWMNTLGKSAKILQPAIFCAV